MKETALEAIYTTGVVAILRGVQEKMIDVAVDALYEGGIRCVEITMNTPGAPRMIERTKARLEGRIWVGAGTVLDSEGAYQAIVSGADFVLAPTLSIPVIEKCLTYGCLAIPGAFTPTEVLTAWQAGARLVKVFPVGTVGPAYIKDLRGPLPQIPTLPVGGVSLENAKAFLEAGAYALGVGGSLFDPKLAVNGDFDELRRRAEAFIKITESVRSR